MELLADRPPEGRAGGLIGDLWLGRLQGGEYLVAIGRRVGDPVDQQLPAITIEADVLQQAIDDGARAAADERPGHHFGPIHGEVAPKRL